MDNPLTPSKIQRLLNLAEDSSFSRMLLTEEDVRLLTTHAAATVPSNRPSYINCESSSGILDLERVEGFGESGMLESMSSLSKSTTFNPGEMTGRSTEAQDSGEAENGPDLTWTDELSKMSLPCDSMTAKIDQQTQELNNIMRHSTVTKDSFHSKRDLSADEASLIAREAPLPVPQSTFTHITTEGISFNNSNVSVGAYFKLRCPEFGNLLGKNDSPDRSNNMMPSISEVSSTTPYEVGKTTHQMFLVDDSLDCVPVKQSKNKQNKTIQPEDKNSNASKQFKKPNIPDPSMSFKIKNKEEKNLHTNSKIPTSVLSVHKPFMNSSKPTDVLLKNIHSSFRMATEDTSEENSLSLSRIADFLGKQSNVSISDILQLQKKNKKEPLTEIQINKLEKDMQVTSLKDTKNMDETNSATTIRSVIPNDKFNIADIVITAPEEDVESDNVKRCTRSKSPSSKSRSTASTVRDNYASFKSESPLQLSQGEAKTPEVLSPNFVYKELDRSVDWQEVLQQKRVSRDGLAKVSEQWAEVVVTPIDGFVGVSYPITISVTTLTDSWLTARIEFIDLPNNGNDLTFDLPRLPLLLSPRKTEQFNFTMTSNMEINGDLDFKILLKDTSVEGDMEQLGFLKVNFKLPTIRAVMANGKNKLTFPPVAERSCYTQTLVLMSDCPFDLQLELSIAETENMFRLKNVVEVKKGDINKVLLEHQGSFEEPTKDEIKKKCKAKMMNKQLCRLTNGNAIRVSVTFNAPKLSESDKSAEPIMSFNGAMNINLIGVNTVLKKVDLVGVVGYANLALNLAKNSLHIMKEPKNVMVSNSGTVLGVWMVRFNAADVPFKVTPSKFELHPLSSKNLSIAYTGPEDCVYDTTVIFEEIASNKQTSLALSGGAEKPKIFPIKTNHSSMSWVRPGTKEISLKNTLDKKIHIRCQIIGDGFSIDLPGVESRGIFCLPFSPLERRTLPIVFTPLSNKPYVATLHIVFDKNSDFSRRIKLYGCAGGEGPRWYKLVSYGGTVHVASSGRSPVDLPLLNSSHAPAFVCATSHFHLQYMSVEATSRLTGGARVLGPRSRHTVSLKVDWARVEQCARGSSGTTALATITVVTGAEITRRRILRIIQSQSTGQYDVSLLPDHLKALATQFEGEDSKMDASLREFNEPKTCLPELISSLQELTAQIDLPQDIADENNTIMIGDDTVIHHHTIAE